MGKSMQGTITSLEAQVNKNSKHRHSTTYHIAKSASVESELLQSSAKKLPSSAIKRVQVSLPIGGESLKNAKPTLLRLKKELTMLKFIVAKYGVHALGNGKKGSTK